MPGVLGKISQSGKNFLEKLEKSTQILLYSLVVLEERAELTSPTAVRARAKNPEEFLWLLPVTMELKLSPSGTANEK